MNHKENPLSQKEEPQQPQSPESQEKVKREQSAKTRLYGAFLDHEIEKGGLFTVDEFLQTPEFAEAKKSYVDFFKTEEGFDVGIGHIHQRFDKYRNSLKGAKDPTTPLTVVNQDLKSPSVKQENEIPPVIPNIDSLRLETDKEAEARIRALDVKYSVTKSVDQSAANDHVFETDKQEDSTKVVEPLDSRDTSPVQEIEAENNPVVAEVFSPDGDSTKQKINTPESVELAEGTFDPEVKKAFENVVESSIKLLNKLDERNRDGLNDLIPESSARIFAQAIADIRDSQKLDDDLKNSLNQAADALTEFGVQREDRLVEDLESLQRLHDIVSDVGQDMVSFGKKIRDTYGDKAEPHIKSLVNLIDNLDLGAQRLTSHMARVRDYLDR